MSTTYYTRADFDAEFPNEDACLEALFYLRFGKLRHCPNCGVIAAEFYRVKNRRCFACVHCRYQLYPTASTVMHRSRTPLKDWFRILYTISLSKNGNAALEVQREIGGTYKRALRLTKQIKKAKELENQELSKLYGQVEVDEAYIGGRRRSSNRFSNKTVIIGGVERGGRMRAVIVDQANATTARKFLDENVVKGSELHTDESGIYNRAHRNYDHHKVKHADHEHVRGDDYTNTIEGAWGLLKPSWTGTYRHVSRQYMHLYLNEFVWKYNHREDESLFHSLLEAVARPGVTDQKIVSADP